MRAAVQAVARAAAGPDDRPDGDLVAAYLRHPDGPAFAALVRRHGPMVYRVCLRAAGNAHDAEDAAQAAFLALARHARSIRRRQSVAAWLHGVAVRIARKARDRSTRQQRREQAAARPESVTADDPSWAEVRAVLDAELAALPDRFRQPLVLCYLQGRTRDEAAKALGWSPATLGRRLEAARDALGRRLRARGIVGAAALPAVLVSDAATGGAVPPALLAACVVHALAAAGRTGTPIPPAVAELCQGVTRTMTVIRTVLVAVLAVGVVAAAGVYAARPADPPKPPDPPPAEAKKPAAADKPAFAFDATGLTVGDLVDALRLDIFKYEVAIPKGRRFAVVLRELDAPDAAPRELKRFAFERVAADGRTTIRVDFTRFDGLAGPALLTEQETIGIGVSCDGCDPGGVGSFVPVPLGSVKLTERTRMTHHSDRHNEESGVKEVRLLSIVRNVTGVGALNYPRAELLIIPE